MNNQGHQLNEAFNFSPFLFLALVTSQRNSVKSAEILVRRDLRQPSDSMKTLALAFLAAMLIPLRSYALDCPRMPEEAAIILVERGADLTLQANDGATAPAGA